MNKVSYNYPNQRDLALYSVDNLLKLLKMLGLKANRRVMRFVYRESVERTMTDTEMFLKQRQRFEAVVKLYRFLRKLRYLRNVPSVTATLKFAARLQVKDYE